MNKTLKSILTLVVTLSVLLAGFSSLRIANAQQSVSGDPAAALGKPNGQDTFR